MKHHGKTAFTLVELLVVIGIIAMLIAILLPVLNKAREAGKAAVCLSRLNQFHKGTKLWQHDNKGRVFPGSGWRAKLATYMRNNKIYICPSDDYPFSSGVDSLLIDIYQTDYDMALEEGPMVHKQVIDATSYNLYFDDAPDTSHGDHDYNDLVLRITQKPNGDIDVTVVSIEAGYHFDLIDAKTRQVYLRDLGRASPPGSTYTVQGGLASYAFNYDTEKVYGVNSKVLALDYYKGMANADADNWQQQCIGSRYPRFARHSHYINVLWTDGRAERTDVKLIQPNPATARKYWHKN